MEPNLPVMAKKLRSLVRVIFFMMKNNISKSKLMVDLNIMMKKRGKIAGKAFQNLIFHHHHNNNNNNTDNSSTGSGSDIVDSQLTFATRPGEYEFSCDTPSHFNRIFPFHLISNKRKHHNSRFFSCAHAPETDDDDTLAANAMVKALEMLNSGAASPALPGFGRTPMVRQLRITDSPFPLREIEEDTHVDEAAEDFINKFYNQLRHQNVTPSR